ncbi:tyrosine kinase receptor Cad96Ca-like [Ptychodera flava]|uniref:tyrosine kinase receptor Cad96Ca-like n=1 Tax=Ptychodera flava TaxID=63121 RepID=UPI00396A6219
MLERSDDSRCEVKILEPNIPLLESCDGLYEPVEYDYDHLLFCENGFLGRGEFGVVQKAVVSDKRYKCVDQEVAVKCLKENATMDDREDSLREIEIMKSLNASHPNVISLIGFCTDPLCIIIELAVNGNLKNYLLKNRSSSDYQNILPNSRNLRSYDLLQFAWQIAKGMSFIASKKIIHRDLATRNILLDENRCCKISDFGFARDVSDTNAYQRKSQLRGRLPIRWMALESLLYSTYTTQSDVWSYGVLLWEIVTLGKPRQAETEHYRVGRCKL